MTRTVDVALIRPQEHDYDYLQWHEDVALGHVLREITTARLSSVVYDFALRPLLSAAAYGEAVGAIARAKPRVIILVIDKHPTNSPHYAGEFVRALRACPDLSDTHLSIYGNTQVGPTRLLDEFPVDSVVLGEENEARLLAETIMEGGQLDCVPGLAFRCDSGSGFVENPPLPNHDAFSESLPPQRYFFDLPEDQRNPFGYVAAIEASRGCYAKCTFCYLRSKERVYGNYGWVGRAPESIVAEMLSLYRAYGAREFSFIDPQFFGPGPRGQAWGRELAARIIDSEMEDLAFSIYARANDMKPDTLRLLKQAGLYAVFIGIESFSAAVLKRYRKGVSVRTNLAAIATLMDLDIRLRMGFVSFDHYTTLEELEESVVALEQLLTTKPHLITQPVFFQNILAPLDDTPAGDEYHLAGASRMAVSQPADRLLLARRQERLTRGGPISTFADPRVALISESTRVLASEITQRSTRLEIACSECLSRGSAVVSLDGSRFTSEAALAWMSDLTRFAITEFARLVTAVKSCGVSSEAADAVLAGIGPRMNAFDLMHLGCGVVPARESRLAIVD